MFRLQANPLEAFLGNQPIELLHLSEKLESEVSAPLHLLKGYQIIDYPEMLICWVILDGEFNIPELQWCRLYRAGADELHFGMAFGDNGVWGNNLAISAAYRELTQLPDFHEFERAFKIEYEEPDNIFLSVFLNSSSGKYIYAELVKALRLACKLVQSINAKLVDSVRFKWKSEYRSDEQIFTKEVVIPILRKLGFSSVRCNHGANEFGRDILFSEIDRFGKIRYCAAQVKAGNISASNGTLLTTLLTQIDDAFALPVHGPGKSKQYYISEVFVICSGKISEGAVQRLNQKIDPRIAGSLHFLDYADIEQFAESLWPFR